MKRRDRIVLVAFVVGFVAGVAAQRLVDVPPSRIVRLKVSVPSPAPLSPTVSPTPPQPLKP